MHTIKLHIEDKVYDKIIWLLSKFNQDEIEIIIDESDLTRTKMYLENELDEIKGNKANFFTLNETEQRLENLIRKHEDHL
jgi:uncharacterized protein YdaL